MNKYGLIEVVAWVMMGLVITCASLFLVSNCENTREAVGRETQQCEVLGREHGCQAHSARSTPNDGCRCRITGAVVEYERAAP